MFIVLCLPYHIAPRFVTIAEIANLIIIGNRLVWCTSDVVIDVHQASFFYDRPSGCWNTEAQRQPRPNETRRRT